MMRTRFTFGGCVAALLALCLQTQTHAQQDPQSSTYFLAPLAFNPAYSGLSNQLNVRSVTRLQWVGWGGAPTTQMLTVDAPFFRDYAGAGVSFVQDNVGARSQTSLMASGAGHIPLNEEWTMSMGLSGGMRFLSYDFNGLRVDDASDELYQTLFQDWSPNFGMGTYFTSAKGYVGYSVPQLFTQALSDSADADVHQRHHYVMAGFRKSHSDYLSVQYGTLIKATSGAPVAVDFQVMANWMDVAGVGGHMRWGESVGLLLSFNLSNTVSAVYLAEMPFNKLRTQNLGTHELALRWNPRAAEKVVMNTRFF